MHFISTSWEVSYEHSESSGQPPPRVDSGIQIPQTLSDSSEHTVQPRARIGHGGVFLNDCLALPASSSGSASTPSLGWLRGENSPPLLPHERK